LGGEGKRPEEVKIRAKQRDDLCHQKAPLGGHWEKKGRSDHWVQRGRKPATCGGRPAAGIGGESKGDAQI